METPSTAASGNFIDDDFELPWNLPPPPQRPPPVTEEESSQLQNAKSVLSGLFSEVYERDADPGRFYQEPTTLQGSAGLPTLPPPPQRPPTLSSNTAEAPCSFGPALHSIPEGDAQDSAKLTSFDGHPSDLAIGVGLSHGADGVGRAHVRFDSQDFRNQTSEGSTENLRGDTDVGQATLLSRPALHSNPLGGSRGKAYRADGSGRDFGNFPAWQLDAREALLDETANDADLRQEHSTKLATDLDWRRAKLSRKQHEIEARRADLELFEKRVVDQEKDVVVEEEFVFCRETQLDADSQHLKRCQSALKLEAKRVKQRRDELERNEVPLREREAELSRMQSELNTLEKEVAVAEQEVQHRSDDLAAMESTLRRRRKEIDGRQAGVAADRRVLDVREEQLEARQTAASAAALGASGFVQHGLPPAPVYAPAPPVIQAVPPVVQAAPPVVQAAPASADPLQQSLAQTIQMLQMQQMQQLQRHLGVNEDSWERDRRPGERDYRDNGRSRADERAWQSQRERERTNELWERDKERDGQLQDLEAKVASSMEALSRQEAALAAVMEAAKETQEVVSKSTQEAKETAAAMMAESARAVKEATAEMFIKSTEAARETASAMVAESAQAVKEIAADTMDKSVEAAKRTAFTVMVENEKGAKWQEQQQRHQPRGRPAAPAASFERQDHSDQSRRTAADKQQAHLAESVAAALEGRRRQRQDELQDELKLASAQLQVITAATSALVTGQSSSVTSQADKAHAGTQASTPSLDQPLRAAAVHIQSHIRGHLARRQHCAAGSRRQALRADHDDGEDAAAVASAAAILRGEQPRLYESLDQGGEFWDPNAGEASDTDEEITRVEERPNTSEFHDSLLSLSGPPAEGITMESHTLTFEDTEGERSFNLQSPLSPNESESQPAVAWEVDLSDWPRVTSQKPGSRSPATVARRRMEKAIEEANHRSVSSQLSHKEEGPVVPQRVLQSVDRLSKGGRSRESKPEVPALKAKESSPPRQRSKSPFAIPERLAKSSERMSRGERTPSQPVPAVVRAPQPLPWKRNVDTSDARASSPGHSSSSPSKSPRVLPDRVVTSSERLFRGDRALENIEPVSALRAPPTRQVLAHSAVAKLSRDTSDARVSSPGHSSGSPGTSSRVLPDRVVTSSERLFRVDRALENIEHVSALRAPPTRQAPAHSPAAKPSRAKPEPSVNSTLLSENSVMNSSLQSAAAANARANRSEPQASRRRQEPETSDSHSRNAQSSKGGVAWTLQVGPSGKRSSPPVLSSASSRAPASRSRSADKDTKSAGIKGNVNTGLSSPRRPLSSRPFRAAVDSPQVNSKVRAASPRGGTPGASETRTWQGPHSPGGTPVLDELFLARSQDEMSPLGRQSAHSSPDRSLLEYLPKTPVVDSAGRSPLPLFTPSTRRQGTSAPRVPSSGGGARSGHSSGSAGRRQPSQQAAKAQPWWAASSEPHSIGHHLSGLHICDGPASPGAIGFHESPSSPPRLPYQAAATSHIRSSGSARHGR